MRCCTLDSAVEGDEPVKDSLTLTDWWKKVSVGFQLLDFLNKCTKVTSYIEVTVYVKDIVVRKSGQMGNLFRPF